MQLREVALAAETLPLCDVRVTCHLAKDGSACLCLRPGKYQQASGHTHHQPAFRKILCDCSFPTCSWAAGQQGPAAGCPSLQTTLSIARPAEL